MLLPSALNRAVEEKVEKTRGVKLIIAFAFFRHRVSLCETSLKHLHRILASTQLYCCIDQAPLQGEILRHRAENFGMPLISKAGVRSFAQEG